MRILKFAAAIAAGVVVLGVAAYAYFLYSPDPTPPHLNGQVQTATIQVGSRLRSYVGYIPAQLPAGAPLVIALHGTTMDGALMRKFTGYEFDSMADTHGFAVFYPDGYKTNWNDCLKAGAVAATLEHVDDVGFILALIGNAQSEFKIDPKKVYLVGYSNGGQLAMTLATLSPGPAAGIAIFGADLPTPDNSTCSQDSRTPPIMIVAGTDDPISPYNGGEVSIFGFQNKGTVVFRTCYGGSIRAPQRNRYAAERGNVAPPRPERSNIGATPHLVEGQRALCRSLFRSRRRAHGATAYIPLSARVGAHNRRSRWPHTSDCIFSPVTL
jgi:polyhydroxybutyrate depolymerase